MSLELDCTYKKEVPYTINAFLKTDRERLEKLGSEIAQQEGIKFEGYSLITLEPYSLDNAKAYLFFA